MTQTPLGTDVRMVQRDLSQTPAHALPAGHAMRPYREGDVSTWVRIQREAAEDLASIDAATFVRSMPGDIAFLIPRVMFLVDPQGVDIGTICAWNDDEFDGHDLGRIHWVAIVSSAQGRGLAKPMLASACDALRQRGYTQAYLDTNTGLIPALNLYAQFGFEPHPRNEEERLAWQAVAPQVKNLKNG